MTGIEVLIRQISWCSQNMAYNLDYIADDKLAWKPAPEAKSALEIVHHAAGAVQGLGALVDASTPAELAAPTTRGEAKQLLQDTTGAYVTKLQSLTEADLGRIVSGTPFGDLPVAQIINMPVVDMLHHHGQLAYIQTLLGDNEPHFFGM